MFYKNHLFKPKSSSPFYSSCSFGAVLVMVLGLTLSLLSAGILGIWVGIEVSFLGAACFMNGVYLEESESVMKYFIIQVVGSLFLLLGILFLIYCNFIFLTNKLVILGLSIKLGIFPFHFWVPGVMSGLSWPSCFVVSVIQKVAPLWFLSNFMFSSSEMEMMEMLAVLTTFVGCFGGLGMMNYRALMGYSSLVHLGFLVILCISGLNFFWMYFIVYGILNLSLMSSLWVMGIYCYSDLLKEGSLNCYENFMWLSLYFFSLAGIPPFSGIFLKVYFLTMCWEFAPLGCIMCTLGSVLSMYYYMSVLMEMIMVWGKGVGNMCNSKTQHKRSVWLPMLSVLVNLMMSYPLFAMVGG